MLLEVECQECGAILDIDTQHYIPAQPVPQISQAEQVEYWRMVAREIATFNKAVTGA